MKQIKLWVTGRERKQADFHLRLELDVMLTLQRALELRPCSVPWAAVCLGEPREDTESRQPQSRVIFKIGCSDIVFAACDTCIRGSRGIPALSRRSSPALRHNQPDGRLNGADAEQLRALRAALHTCLALEQIGETRI